MPLIILIFIIVTAFLILRGLNKPQVTSSRAAASSCVCFPNEDYRANCFDGTNSPDAYAGKGPDDKLKCCFGPYNDPVYGKFATVKYSFPHFETVLDSKCRNETTDKVTVSPTPSRTYRCLYGPINYGSCKAVYLYKKVDSNNELYGYYTDSLCLTRYDLSVLKRCLPAATPTAKVEKMKKITIVNPNSYELTIQRALYGLYDPDTKKTPGRTYVKPFSVKGGELVIDDGSTGYGWIFSKMKAGYRKQFDLTNDKFCNSKNSQLKTYVLISYRRGSGFFSSFAYPARDKTFEVPCEKDNFEIEIPLKY